MSWKNKVKYFLHGVPFTLLFMNILILWGYLLLVVGRLGPAGGDIIGIVVLFLIVGGLNALIAGGLDAITPQRIQHILPSKLRKILQWRLWFKMKRSIFRTLFQGFLLTLLLIVTTFIFVTLPSIFIPGGSTTIVSLIVTFYVDGYVCKNIAAALRGIED